MASPLFRRKPLHVLLEELHLRLPHLVGRVGVLLLEDVHFRLEFLLHLGVLRHRDLALAGEREEAEPHADRRQDDRDAVVLHDAADTLTRKRGKGQRTDH